MTFVRTKLALEQLAVGEILRIRLRDGEPRHNVPRAVRDHGHEIIEPGARWTAICSSCACARAAEAAQPQAAGWPFQSAVRIEVAAHGVGGGPVAVGALIVVGPHADPLEAVLQVELLGGDIVDRDLEEHLPRADRPAALHAGAQEVAGDAAPAVGGRHADREQLALVAHHPAEREADAAQAVEAGEAALGEPRDQAEAAGHRQQVGEVGAAPRLLEAALVQPRQPAEVERADRANADRRRLRPAPPCQRRAANERGSRANACVRLAEIERAQHRARPGHCTAGEPAPRGPGKIPGIEVRLNHAIVGRVRQRACAAAASPTTRQRRRQIGRRRSQRRQGRLGQRRQIGCEALGVDLARAGHRAAPGSAADSRRAAAPASASSLERADAEHRATQRQRQCPGDGDAGAQRR